VEFVRTLAAAYLIVTLATAALAKLKSWRASAVSVLRESVIPPRAATAVVLAVAAVELSLATLFMLGAEPTGAGFAAMGLFLSFCGYQLLVAARTNSLMCSCAGVLRTDPASAPAVSGTVLACLIQAGLSYFLAITRADASGVFRLITFAAWVLPLIVILAGLLRRTRRSDGHARLQEEPAFYRQGFEEFSGKGTAG
jgi:hypothetical protein